MARQSAIRVDMQPRESQYAPLLVGIAAYVAGGATVWLGVLFGIDYVRTANAGPDSPKPGFLLACTRFDGIHYTAIVEDGYNYDPGRRSEVAFFPAYPLLSQAVSALTGLNARSALLVVSNAMLLGVFVLFAAYLRGRAPPLDQPTRWLTLMLFGLWPVALFYRMGYSESTFLFFALLMLYGQVHSWPLPVLAALAGAATAARPVGVAATAAFVWYVVSDPARGSRARRSLLALAYIPLASWGLLAYMNYQFVEFGTPLAFAQTQTHWRYGVSNPDDFGAKMDALLSGEPIWGEYVPGSLNNWSRLQKDDNWPFNLAFWNPILFVLAVLLVLVGSAARWLTGPEVVLGLGLLIIPYLTRAYENAMFSHARFAAVVLPAYIVLAQLLRRLPNGVSWVVLTACAALQTVWAALFAAGYEFF